MQKRRGRQLERLDDARAVALLRQIHQGDQQAFVELFGAINRRVFLFVKHRLGDRADAEEVLNDTAMELWRHPDRFRGDSRFMTYVLGIANNKATSLLRCRGRLEVDSGDDLEDVADDNPTPFDALCRNEERAAIVRCMETLPERQRTIVHLAYFEGLSREEIGRVVGCEGNAVRQHLFKALKKMASYLAASPGSGRTSRVDCETADMTKNNKERVTREATRERSGSWWAEHANREDPDRDWADAVKSAPDARQRAESHVSRR